MVREGSSDVRGGSHNSMDEAADLPPGGDRPDLGYRLGLPAWAFPGWRDRYFPARPSPLAGYARVFNAVEGNTTFYRVPDEKTVDGWRAAVDGTDFRFCFKLPKTVTHERRPAVADLDAFLFAIGPLRDFLGPLLVQFPARTGPDELSHVHAVLERVPRSLHVVLEVRHPRFFSEPELLRPTLETYGCARVMMDARPLFEGDRQHAEVLSALHEKPDVPVLWQERCDPLFVRLVLHPDRVSNTPYIEAWADRVAEDLAAGRDAWMMIHCPNNLHCPELALAFHAALRQRGNLGTLPELPPWPVPSAPQLGFDLGV